MGAGSALTGRATRRGLNQRRLDTSTVARLRRDVLGSEGGSHPPSWSPRDDSAELVATKSKRAAFRRLSHWCLLAWASPVDTPTRGLRIEDGLDLAVACLSWSWSYFRVLICHRVVSHWGSSASLGDLPRLLPCVKATLGDRPPAFYGRLHPLVQFPSFRVPSSSFLLTPFGVSLVSPWVCRPMRCDQLPSTGGLPPWRGFPTPRRVSDLRLSQPLAGLLQLLAPWVCFTPQPLKGSSPEGAAGKPASRLGRGTWFPTSSA